MNIQFDKKMGSARPPLFSSPLAKKDGETSRSRVVLFSFMIHRHHCMHGHTFKHTCTNGSQDNQIHVTKKTNDRSASEMKNLELNLNPPTGSTPICHLSLMEYGVG